MTAVYRTQLIMILISTSRQTNEHNNARLRAVNCSLSIYGFNQRENCYGTCTAILIISNVKILQIVHLVCVQSSLLNYDLRSCAAYKYSLMNLNVNSCECAKRAGEKERYKGLPTIAISLSFNVQHQ